jgi:hypothetical protein
MGERRARQFLVEVESRSNGEKFYTAVLYYIEFLGPNAPKQSKSRNGENHCGYWPNQQLPTKA